MSIAFLVLSALGALMVALSYRPIRREPFTVICFVSTFLMEEAALQTVVVQVALTALFGAYGAFSTWLGWLGLGFAVAGWIGLIGLAVCGHRAASVVAAALAYASDGEILFTDEQRTARWARWWRLVLTTPGKGRRVERIRNIDYWGDGIRRHRLDVLRPRGGIEGAPVLLYIHGGAWVIGEKREQGRPMMHELVERGWVCVAINYRLSPRATWPDHVIDCKRAIAWVREHIGEYGGDPSFLALSGGSAGGHLSALCALSAHDTRWQPGFEEADTSVDACVPFYGVMDMTGSPMGSGIFGPGLLELLEDRVMKVKEAEHPEVYEQASPTHWVHAEAPPFFVFHGTNDTLVPIEVARRFVDSLRSTSTSTVAYAELPLAQHAFDVMASFRCRATTAGVVAFLEAVRTRSLSPQPASTPEPQPASTPENPPVDGQILSNLT